MKEYVKSFVIGSSWLVFILFFIAVSSYNKIKIIKYSYDDYYELMRLKRIPENFVLEEDQDKDLDDLKISKATGEEDRCTICLCDIDKDEDIINLKCSHTFHDECLRQYLKEYDFKCPMCREEVGKSKAHV